MDRDKAFEKVRRLFDIGCSIEDGMDLLWTLAEAALTQEREAHEQTRGERDGALDHIAEVCQERDAYEEEIAANCPEDQTLAETMTALRHDNESQKALRGEVEQKEEAAYQGGGR